MIANTAEKPRNWCSVVDEVARTTQKCSRCDDTRKLYNEVIDVLTTHEGIINLCHSRGSLPEFVLQDILQQSNKLRRKLETWKSI